MDGVEQSPQRAGIGMLGVLALGEKHPSPWQLNGRDNDWHLRADLEGLRRARCGPAVHLYEGHQAHDSVRSGIGFLEPAGVLRGSGFGDGPYAAERMAARTSKASAGSASSGRETETRLTMPV